MKDLKTFYFDTETSGLSNYFSQILSAFFLGKDSITGSEIGLDVKCSMEWSRLPETEALIVNGYPLPSLVQENSLYTGMHEIVKFVDEHTPSIWVAHNASFDSGMISNAIYQNLASVNMYPFKNNGNTLFDSLMLMRAIHGFDSLSGIDIPINDKGYPVFKLESLCNANSIEIDAHNAEGDTRALKELVELVKVKSPEIYDQALLCSSKKYVRQKIMDQPYIFAAIGTERNFGVRALAPVAFSEDGGDVVVVDLLSDLESIKNYSPLEMCGFLGNRVHKKYSVFRIPLNKGNVFFAPDELPFIMQLTSDFDEKELFRKASMMRRDEILHQTAKEALSWRSNSFGSEDPTVEERIYSHFPTPGEKTFISAFNLAEPEDKWELIEHYSTILNDDRFTRLARRVVLQNWRSYCPPEIVENFTGWCVERLFSEPMNQEQVPKWATIYSCLSSVSKLRRKYPEKSDRIDELEDFYHNIAARVGVDTSQTFDN